MSDWPFALHWNAGADMTLSLVRRAELPKVFEQRKPPRYRYITVNKLTMNEVY